MLRFESIIDNIKNTSIKKQIIKIHSTKKFLKKDLMKLNIIKIKELRIKICYFCEKKNNLKKKIAHRSNKNNKKMNRNIRERKHYKRLYKTFINNILRRRMSNI